MALTKEKLDKINDTILQIQDISRAERATVVIGSRNERHFSTYRTSITGETERISTEDDEQVFAIASIFKLFIASAAFIMIDKLSASPDPENRYRKLQGAWNKSFTVVFNECSTDTQLSPLAGNPTIQQLLVHFKGVCNFNHLLLGPDGTPLQSRNDFLRTVTQYAEETHGKDDAEEGWLEYSNANYILIALLVEVVSDMSISEFIKMYILKPLGMNHTYLSAEGLSLHPSKNQAHPNLVSSDGYRRPVISGRVLGLADTIELVVLGPYTSGADLGRFFGTLQLALDGTATGLFDNALVRALFRTISNFGGGKYGYKPGVLYTPLNSTHCGCRSLNRLISPDSESLKYQMGKPSHGKDVEAFYLAGSATGWGCTAYFMPDKRAFVIVLTNTSGPLDSSDLISRVCLHEMFDLQPSVNGRRYIPQHLKGHEEMSLAELNRAHYVRLAAQMFKENASVMRELEEADAAKDIWTDECAEICGVYINRTYEQTLEVTNCEGKLRVKLSGESKSSQLMRFVPKGDAFRICSMDSLDGDSPGLSIDCFGAWKNLQFKVERVNNAVTCLSRKGLKLEDRFIRQ